MKTLCRESLDLVMVDVSMPVVGGEALVGIALRNRLGSCPIVLYSGKDPEELESLVSLCGADGFIKKGTHGQELFDQVERFLNLPPRSDELPHVYVTPLPTRR